MLPKEPFPISASLAEFDGARAVCTTAGDEQFHIALLLTGNMVAFHPDGIGLGGGVIIVWGGTCKIGERKISI